MASKNDRQILKVERTTRYVHSRGEDTAVNQVVIVEDDVNLASLLNALKKYDADLDLKKVKVEYGQCGSHEIHVWWVAD